MSEPMVSKRDRKIREKISVARADEIIEDLGMQ